MAKKVYIAELDAKTVTLLQKIQQAQDATIAASNKMQSAFNKVSAATEKSMNQSGKSVVNFSKRDLGMLATQLATTSEVTGRLGSQLGNLATGLLTGGFIGAAFAGFAALLNGLTQRAKEYTEAIEKLKDSKITLSEKVKIYKEQMQELADPGFWELLRQGGKATFFGWSEAIDDVRERAFQLQQTLAGQMIMTTHGKGYLGALYKDLATTKSLQGSAPSKSAAISYNKEILEIQKKIDEVLGKQVEKKKEDLDLTIQQYDIMEDIYEVIRKEEDQLLGDVGIGSGKPGTGRFDRIWDPKKKFFKESIEEAQNPMTALVSLSNQMASNFQWAGHTFVGQLSQAIAMVDSISNMILTIASMFGGGGGFGIGGLLSLIGLEKGGRVSNRFGNVSVSNIPSFAMGGSYSTPGWSGPMAGGYPVMVHKNETLDVYNSGQSSRMEKKLDGIRNAIMAGTLASTRKERGGGGNIVVKIGSKEIAKIVQKELNTMANNNFNLSQLR